MEPQEFADMVQDIRRVEKAKGEVHYGPTEQEKGNIVFRKSIFAVQDIKKGELLSEENIRVIRPGYGMKPKYLGDVLGKEVLCDVSRGMPILKKMVGGI